MRCFNASAVSTLWFILTAVGGEIKHRVCIKFCNKFGKFAAETLENAS
jgi:hypothetical protein